MKKSLILSMLMCSLYSMGQISTQSNAHGSILITPKGLQSKSNPSADTTNVALGPSTLKANTTGNSNTAIGSGALVFNTIGVKNTATGASVLRNNTTGSYNTGHGESALVSNTSGVYNTATGIYALQSNTTGYENTANGSKALQSNTTGYYNTAYGAEALQSNTIGYENTAYGNYALYNNTTGTQNTAIGATSLINNTTGYSNTALGISAGLSNSTGRNNTFIGTQANANSSNLNNATALGYLASVNASNKIRLGNAQVTVIEGQVAYTYPSDRRLKENIIYTSRLGLDFINKLQTVSYSYKSDNTHVRHDGFVAQDIEAVMKELNVPFSGLKKSDDGMYSLAYSDFVMPLVNAAKELKQQNDEQQSEINDLKKQLAALAQRMTEMETAKTEAKMNDSEAAKR
ncbi:hypothetical protein GVN20_24555 [Runella sp. CRIBMP]|uniref:tail fiber domain-containing protein n=1 Tax=Runella sp. CRIBMP TaxID=2683261 RepID=UPI0014136D20|nr:tail fiber domain-containing protein [Runella sp. CRIBMP]NBB22548.1 hypothetical protein [Runella sp. CRIBMP]